MVRSRSNLVSGIVEVANCFLMLFGAAIAIEGYWIRRASVKERLGSLAAFVLFFSFSLTHAGWMIVSGAAILLFITVIQWKRRTPSV